MLRRIAALSSAVLLLGAPAMAWAQTDMATYGDTMRKHGHVSPATKASQSTSGASHSKGAKKTPGKKMHAGKT